MSLVRGEPFRELVSLRQAMDRLFEDALIRPYSLLEDVVGTREAAVDMYQTGDAVVVSMALPGVKPEEVEVTISGDTLTVKGEAKAEREVRRDDYLRQERRYGPSLARYLCPARFRGTRPRLALRTAC
ncbi:MAG: Hsp20/alpha crystallin family protein [Chloroflexi bacterium]|nr:Hsp20/alpha crystallin family protein [Chloroflexota bacterium]